jgi:DNA-binding transcriptional regulator WhiA
MSMGSGERRLATEIRAELAAVSPPRRCDREAEAAALSSVAWRRHSARQAPLLRTALRLGHRPGSAGPAVPAWRWDDAAQHCRIAYLRGLFLAHGSLSVSDGRVHLEFVLDPDAATELAPRLRALGLPASLRLRRGRGVLTWKSAEAVTTFLRLAGARGTPLDLEAQRVARAVRGDLNRAINAEAANLARTVAAAVRQLDAIEALASDGRLAALHRETRAVAAARREGPGATLGELADATGLHRSTVQRELRRLERLAAEEVRAA